jgi:hypothetical protein
VICRIWRGWTTPENADAYEKVVRGSVIPDIERMRIRGLEQIDFLRRVHAHEVEFVTMMWFDDLTSVRSFTGEDYEVSHVPSEARAVLSHFDERSAHWEVLDQRSECASSAARDRLLVSRGGPVTGKAVVPSRWQHNCPGGPILGADG